MACCRCWSCDRCCGYAELLLEDLHELGELEDSHLLDFLDDLLELRRNFYLCLYVSSRSGCGCCFLYDCVCFYFVHNN